LYAVDGAGCGAIIIHPELFMFSMRALPQSIFSMTEHVCCSIYNMKPIGTVMCFEGGRVP
jgi:hypothetical protein